MVATKLDKSQRRPTFPFGTERVAPSVPEASAPARAARPVTPEAIALAKEIASHLVAVRDQMTTQRTIGSMVVLERVTVENRITFYHLTDEARDALRDGMALPWG